MIIASLATIPSRVAIVELAVRSLHRQPEIDQIHVHFAGVFEPPAWVRNYSKVKPITSAETRLFCAEAKLLPLIDAHDGTIVLTCDDDIQYPRNYAKRMSEALQHHAGAALCVYGCILQDPAGGFAGNLISYGVESALIEDQPVHLPGTGTMALEASFHTAHLVRHCMHTHNMTDVSAGCFFHMYGIPVIALARPHRWLQLTPHGGPKISDGWNRDPWERDFLARAHHWKTIQPNARNLSCAA